MKALFFVGSSREDLRAFPLDARREAGFELYRVQNRLNPTDWKSMKAIGAGVREIRIHTGGQFRVIYVASLGDAVYVLHAFQKKSRATRRSDIEIARRRFRQLGG